jgi:hypothetical protein
MLIRPPIARPLLGVCIFLAACSGDPTNPAAAPTIISTRVSVNPTNALSAVVAYNVENADSARVVYWTDGPFREQTTPYYPVVNGTGQVATLGLQSGTIYHNVLQVVSAGGSVHSEQLDVTSGSIPPELQRVTLTTSGNPGPGLTMTTLTVDASAFVIAFDSTGAIRWYRGFVGPPPVEAKQQRSGNFTVYLGTSVGWQTGPGEFVEFSPGGQQLRTLAAPAPYFTDPHELWVVQRSDGQEEVHLFGYDIRTVDMSALGGQAATPIAGHQVLRLTPAGNAEFFWNGWDYLKLSDWIEPPLPSQQAIGDFDHPNSLDFDLDGNYIVSWRNLGEVTKIDAVTGAIIWRLGGVHNQFTFINDPLGGFSGQHSARILSDGHLLLYDNGLRHHPPESRAVEYSIDPVAKTATLVWQFRHDPIIATPFVGSVQRLANGNTLIGYGNAAHATEVSSDGKVLWEADIKVDGQPRTVYRFVRLASLYRYEVP